jgi:hypothetical protein
MTEKRVKCGNTYSLWELVVTGVIQGSVLGPIVFFLYISDTTTNSNTRRQQPQACRQIRLFGRSSQ